MRRERRCAHAVAQFRRQRAHNERIAPVRLIEQTRQSGADLVYRADAFPGLGVGEASQFLGERQIGRVVQYV